MCHTAQWSNLRNTLLHDFYYRLKGKGILTNNGLICIPSQQSFSLQINVSKNLYFSGVLVLKVC